MAHSRRVPASPPASTVREEAGERRGASSRERPDGKAQLPRAPAGHFSASPASLHGKIATRIWETAVRAPSHRLLESTSGAIPFEACAGAIFVFYFLLLFLGYKALRLLRKVALPAAGSSRRSVVFLGPSGGGKTTLFLLLRNGKVTETFPSMQENVETLCVEEKAAEGGEVNEEAHEMTEQKKKRSARDVSLCTVVDFPGHAKLQVLANPYIDRASAIVFLVDAADKKSFKTAAEQLYELFTRPQLHQQQVPLLLVINKADLPDARAENTVIEDLEREIERSRASRAALLEGEDDVTNFIGVEGEVFKLCEHSPFPIEVCSASVKKGEISAIREFMRCGSVSNKFHERFH